MRYKRLGRCGLKVGELSLVTGSWGVGTTEDKSVREMMALAMDLGIIYLDNGPHVGEAHAGRESFH
jgi:aryl-alcohol dehydrogenase-like predicted oxidoreductase